MCLWLLTACLGLLPTNPTQTNVVVVQGVPSPILQPTVAPTMSPATTTTTAAPASSTASTSATSSTSTPATTPASTTMATPASTSASTPASTSASTPVSTTASTSTSMPPGTPSVTPAVTSMPTNTASGGGVDLPVLLCNNPDIVCIFNPDENATGPPIDPRLGTTPTPPSAPLQAPPIMGYNARIPSYNMAVKFPRQRRSLNEKKMGIKEIMNNFHYIINEKHEIKKRQSCRCVPAGTCINNGINSGAGMIDFRIVTPGGGNNGGQCPAGQEYCCGPTSAGPQINCGTLQTVPTPAIAPKAGQANFGEFPWQAMILTKQNDYIAGGVLINQLNVLTVTHRITQFVVAGTAPNVKVRLGEWDAAGTYEPIPFQEYTILKVFSHPMYNPSTLQYDITMLRLSAAVPFTPAAGAAPTINTACLPPSPTTTYTGQTCWVAGWGKDMFGVQGQYQQILKKVDVPIISSGTCQTQLQTARLGPTYVLDTTSFVCAGGAANKDSCTGDGGSGLVCPVSGQWVLVGLVSWGLGCASANVPAAYVNIAALLPWIQQQIAAP